MTQQSSILRIASGTSRSVFAVLIAAAAVFAAGTQSVGHHSTATITADGFQGGGGDFGGGGAGGSW